MRLDFAIEGGKSVDLYRRPLLIFDEALNIKYSAGGLNY
jgi:hypothetical protein